MAKEVIFSNVAHFQMVMNTGHLIHVFVDAENTLGAKWAEAKRLDGGHLVIRVLAKKPRSKPRKKKGG